MIKRYEAPNAGVSFDTHNKIALWAEFTRAYAALAIGNDTRLDSRQLDALHKELNTARVPLPEEVEGREARLGHDVVAFLDLYTEEMSYELKRYIHYGLTSSDLVDNAHFSRLRHHAHSMSVLIEELGQATERWELTETTRAGRTHGQVADLTSLGHQMWVYRSVLAEVAADFEVYSRDIIVKSAGPTGRTPLLAFRDQQIASNLGGRVVPSTQVIPRDYQVAWAALYLRLAGVLENMALLVRLGARSEVQEVQEGGVADRVGSSAMPHKRNPIDSEKVCGLARLARGYFMTIAEGSALWEDRDLTNSSMERVAVPDLASTVEHMLITMTKVIKHLQVDYDRMQRSMRNPRTQSNMLQALAQKHFGIGPIQAGNLVRDYVEFDGPGMPVDVAGLTKELQVSPRTVRAWLDEAKAIWTSLVY